MSGLRTPATLIGAALGNAAGPSRDVFWSCFANFVSEAMKPNVGIVGALALIEPAAAAGIGALAVVCGLQRYLKGRRDSAKEEAFKAKVRELAERAARGGDVLADLADGTIELNVAFDDLVKQDLADCIADTLGRNGSSIREALHDEFREAFGGAATLDQFHELVCGYGAFRETVEILLWTQDQRGREQTQLLLWIREAIEKLQHNSPSSEDFYSWRVLASIDPQRARGQIAVHESISRRCNDYGIGEEARDRAVRTCMEAAGLAAITECIYGGASAEQALAAFRVAFEAIGKLRTSGGAEQVTSVEAHRAKKLIAAIAACGHRLSWRSETPIGEWLANPQEELGLGDHWLIAIASLSDETLRDQILRRLPNGNWRIHGNPGRAEHAIMNLIEGMGAYLAALRDPGGRHDDPARIARAIDATTGWIDLDYYDNAILNERESELRLCFDALQLHTCCNACTELALQAHARRFTDLAADALAQVVDTEVRRIAERVCVLVRDGRVSGDLIPMHLEPGGHLEHLAIHDPDAHDAVLDLFDMIVDHRDNHSGPGWTSWVHYFRDYGQLSRNPAVRRLSRDALHRKCARS